MKWLQSLLLLVWTTHIAPQDHSVQKREASDGEKKVVCYYTNWSVYRPGTAKFTPQNINPYLCTHLIYAFGGLDRENGLRPYDKYQDIEQGGYAKFTGLKTFNKKLKTLLAIGGWNEGSARFSPLVADEERRREFVKNVVKFLRVNHFDGLDLDWEYPSFRDGGKPKDRENYASLVQELREEFDRESSKTGRPRMLLTMAVPAGIEYINKGYDVEKLNKYLDFMNILSYDYHSAFEPAVNHHSPLYPLEEESEYNFDAQLSIDYTIKHYLKAGADRQKLVLGIPTYGRSYTLFNKESNQLGAPADGPGEQGDATREKGYLAYYEICSSVKEDSNWTVEQPKAEAMGPYAYKGNQWVGYDDEDIVKLKAQYVNEKGLGGIMFWSIDNDDFRGTCHGRPNPLIEAGKEALYGTAGPSNNLISSSETKVVTQVPSTTRRSKPRTKPTARTTPTSKTTPNPLTTPEPPTTPDPGSDFKCKDEGFFPHPRDCKKYFWCLDSGPSNLGIVAHQFTCPSGLFFNKAADSCDYTRNVFCNKKSSSTDKTSSASTKVITATAKTTSNRQTTTTTTAPTTTTTEAVIIEEEEYEEEDSAEEDPKAIKQLITLIKKLGGVAELEKQLNLEHSPDVTTPAISRTLYNKVLNTATPRYQSKFRNGPGPQNEGLKPDQTAASRKEKPQYVTIRRERPSTEAPNDNEDEETEIETQSPKYKSIQRTKSVDESSQEEEEVQEVQTPKYASIFRNRNSPSKEPKSSSPKYVTLQRNRASQAAPPPSPVEEEVDEGPSSESSPKVITPKYVTLRRQRPQLLDPESEDQEVKNKEITIEDNPVTEVTETSSTIKPRVKIQVPRNRTQFRRPNASILRTRSTAKPSTEAPEPITETPRPPNKLFRRRKIRPDTPSSTLSTTTVITEEPASNIEAITSRGRKIEFPRRVNKSNYNNNVPEAAALQYTNSSLDYEDTRADSGSVSNRIGSLEESPSSSNIDKISDLANVAVVAIHNLATIGPGLVTTKIDKVPVRQLIVTQPPPPLAPTIPIVVAPIKKYNYRGNVKPYLRQTTSAPAVRPPSPYRLQDPLFDYDSEYYAEPVDVPLSGKVRIHNDGYIECLDVGNFPHPFSCRKFISCAKMENGNLLGWEYTCPRGLSFDPIGGMCNWSAGLGCKE